MKRILSLLFSITLSFTFFPIDAFAAPIDETRSVDGATSLFAQTSNIASGMWGTCPWELSTDGTLTVHPGKAATGGSSPWNIDQHKTKIKKIIFASEGEAKVEAPMNCSGLFAPYGAVPTTFEFIDFSGFDTSKTTNMGSMFWDCSSLVTLDFSSFDTSRVRDMNYMFNGCASLVSVDVSSFDTSNVEGMQDMFHGCASLEGLDLSSFNTSRVGSIWNMFRDCASLAYLDISSFDTSKYWGGDIFTGCYELAHVVVGEKTLANLSLHDTKINDRADWYSQADGAWYTVEQINTSRRSIADIYTKSEQVTPSIVIGNGATWQPESNMALAFRSSAPFTDFECVEVDSSKVQASNYELCEGSTVVSLKPGYLSTLAAGSHTIGVVSKNGAASANFIIERPMKSNNPDETNNPINSDNTNATAKTQVMHRLYNPNSGEHFYTADTSERDATMIAGWKYEGVGWTAPAASATPVYRLYSGTDHHYCIGEGERDALVAAGWNYEGIGWYSDDAKGVPLYRQFNPNVDPNASTNNSGSHNYTKDFDEHKSLVFIGWRDEGIGWYGVR